MANAARAAEPAVVKATGTVEPRVVVDVSPAMAGIIKKLGAEPDDSTKTIDYGSQVKKGTILAELDTTTAEPAVTKAKAELRVAQTEIELVKALLAQAERELDRAQKRVGDKSADAADVEVAKAALAVAQARIRTKEAAFEQRRAELEIAQANLDRCFLRSPIDGVLIDRRFNAGQWVAPSPNQPSAFLIADLSKFQVWTSVSESDIGHVAVGQKARFTVGAFPDTKFTGRVVRIRLNAAMNQNAVLFTVEIDVDESPDRLMPYLTADVEIETGKR
jgi:HlyD family secretion protein